MSWTIWDVRTWLCSLKISHGLPSVRKNFKHWIYVNGFINLSSLLNPPPPPISSKGSFAIHLPPKKSGNPRNLPRYYYWPKSESTHTFLGYTRIYGYKYQRECLYANRIVYKNKSYEFHIWIVSNRGKTNLKEKYVANLFLDAIRRNTLQIVRKHNEKKLWVFSVLIEKKYQSKIYSQGKHKSRQFVLLTPIRKLRIAWIALEAVAILRVNQAYMGSWEIFI